MQKRYTYPMTVFGILILVLMLAACGENTPTGPTAQQLISNAQAAIQKVTAYHFNLNAENPGSAGLITVESADGDTIVPDKLKANANALILGSVAAVQIVAIKDKQYVTDPITGKWTQTTGLLDPRTLSNQQTGIAAILGQIQNPSAPTDSTVDGQSCWSIDGKLDTQILAGITGGGTPAGTTVATTICIGKSDNLPYLIRLNGIAVQGDTDKTVRTFKLSKFNESVTITAPI